MAYNRYNFLSRVKEVNEIYVKYSSKGVFTEYIFNTYIKDVYKISRSTFWNYLSIPYEKELKIELEKRAKREATKKAQTQINFED